MKPLRVSLKRAPLTRGFCLILFACLFIFLNSYSIKGSTTYTKFFFYENKTTYDYTLSGLYNGANGSIDWDNYQSGLPSDATQLYFRVAYKGTTGANNANPHYLLYPPRIVGTPNVHAFFTVYVDLSNRYNSEYGFVECDSNHVTKYWVNETEGTTGTVFITLLDYAEVI